MMKDDGIELTPVDGDGASSSHARESTGLMAKSGASNTKSKWVRVTKGVVHAKQFLSDEGNDKEKKEMMNQRRLAHLNKFSGGRTKADPTPSIVPEATRRGRRDRAPVVLYKAGVQKISTKPKFQTAWQIYGGRSFLSSDWKHDDVEEIVVEDDDDLANEFFNFYDDRSAMRDEPRDESRDESMADMAGPGEEVITHAGPLGDMLKKGKKALTIKPKKRKKAWSLFANLLRRKMKRSYNEKLQFDDRREYFTVWLSFVQTVIMIVVLCIYPFAPIGIDVKKVRDDVLLSREGVLYKENLQQKVIESFWLGPTLENLILLGAKYAPCMRRDDKVFAEIMAERRSENSTGCCMALKSNGCIQRPEKDCMTPSVEFGAKKVCGQDPDYCLLASPIPSKWDRDTIISWPKCKKKAPVKQADNLRHMTCEVTGRPCCVKTQGQCVITTQENCNFRKGKYHPQHTLCSQVDCLAATCGNSFYNDDNPDQFYRLFISLFLCAGILHLVVVLIFNFTILRDIEGYAGWFRTSLIFILTGAAGNLWSSILLPYQAEVGESGAMFGIFACVFVEGIQSWSILQRPLLYFGKLVGILVVLLLFGLLPMVDNFAHIFGFLYGLLLGFLILPTIVTKDPDTDPDGHAREKKINLIISLVSLVLAILLTVLGIILFYYSQNTQSKAIAFLNCPFGEKFCQNFHQGQEIESREIEY